ncbi:hypothetical protein JZ751_024222 [Albula glossodonta]|uniref:Uncharacterized protein n=1 Tax=Albula glossodonta TaxID=121402 RepID=A0A8T2NRQ8_9TELE|nr:hypothetical protein JZ751_024222 [Albula glossodonta]
MQWVSYCSSVSQLRERSKLFLTLPGAFSCCHSYQTAARPRPCESPRKRSLQMPTAHSCHLASAMQLIPPVVSLIFRRSLVCSSFWADSPAVTRSPGASLLALCSLELGELIQVTEDLQPADG